MKSSTLYSPKIPKERIEALEEILSDSSVQYDSSPGVYVRSDKDRELDVLWQGFKINSKDERSPVVYLVIGFITGVICMFLMSSILNFGSPSSDSIAQSRQKDEGFINLNLFKKGNNELTKKDTKIPVEVSTQTGQTAYAKTQKYVIQSGDSLGAVAVKFYGSEDPANIEKIQIANGMDDPNKLQIGQEIIVPVE